MTQSLIIRTCITESFLNWEYKNLIAMAYYYSPSLESPRDTVCRMWATSLDTQWTYLEDEASLGFHKVDQGSR